MLSGTLLKPQDVALRKASKGSRKELPRRRRGPRREYSGKTGSVLLGH